MKVFQRLFVIACVLAIPAFLFFGTGCGGDDDGGDEATTPKWTVMMYGAGNNNLDGANNNTSYIVQDLQDMEKVGSTGDLNIIAMVSSQRLAGGAKYYKVEYYPSENPDQISSTVLENKGTKDMSDPATLKEFMNYCKQNYPAERYLLLIDDHGAGWPGSCSDDLAGAGGMLTMTELKNAILQSDLQRVDIVTFHACLMAMVEVGYELRGVADYMTACQFTMPMENVLGADLWLDWLRNNSGATSQQVATKIAEKVIERAQFKQKTTHYAVIKLSEMQNLGAKVGTFGGHLVTASGDHGDEVIHAWTQTHSSQYDNQAYTDLREFAGKVKLETNLQNNNLIVTSADDVISAINAAVPFNNSYFQPPDQPMARGGLNIHFPSEAQAFDSANYVRLDFRQTNWHSFISAFLGAGGSTPGTCPSTCATAAQVAVGQTITECTFTAQVTQNWFVYNLAPGNYRFQLGNFPNGADYDLYSYVQCSDYPNNYTGCSSEQVGPEDFTCTVNTNVVLYVLVNAYQAPYGSYALLISQAGANATEVIPSYTLQR